MIESLRKGMMQSTEQSLADYLEHGTRENRRYDEPLRVTPKGRADLARSLDWWQLVELATCRALDDSDYAAQAERVSI